jgi:hypothetical protein
MLDPVRFAQGKKSCYLIKRKISHQPDKPVTLRNSPTNKGNKGQLLNAKTPVLADIFSKYRLKMPANTGV